jgi:ATP-dependent exoDNAse (exonuclease V) beta subunit
VDFKTDRISPDDAAPRATHYHDQIGAYREALERITGTRVSRACLVFLAARTVIEL